ncbi:MAG TPA: extracellular solute-binding protein [Acetivibrio sp.]|uniref:ABC transporter substrate-binding protein n=1 Tax=Acetivibrio sp. TaxID=1872092 RepID=UPI002C410F11|nr:extracellular solute-binding protein [Acetivibrio sp.]HOM02960.1 extracellular solute-binding protein [Acetivibrio sp.]
MKKFKIAVLGLLVLSILLSTSCSENQDGTQDVIGGKIVMYAAPGDNIQPEVRSVIRSKYPNVEFEVVSFNNADEFKNRLLTELMAGEGPDVIVLSPSTKKGSITIETMRKLVESGALCDLEPYISKDEEMNLSEYNETVLNSGVINGKRYFIPIAYDVPILWTANSILEKNNIENKITNWTLKDMADFAVRFKKENSDKYLFGYGDGFIRNIMYANWREFVDYDKKQASFDSDEFAKLLEFTGQVERAGICNEELIREYSGMEFEALKNGKITLISSTEYPINPWELWYRNSHINYYFNPDSIRLSKLPAFRDSMKIVAHPTDIVAINKNSKNKMTAYEVLKAFLSKEIQSSQQFRNLMGIPVNNEAIKELVEKYSTEEGKTTLPVGTAISETMDTVPLPESVEAEYNSIINGVTECVLVDEQIIDFMIEGFNEYKKGNMSARDAAKLVQQKVTLFLNE